MPEKTSKAFSPAGLSSFFEICDMTSDGKPIPDLRRAGARGGGFGLKKGVTTEVFATEAHTNRIEVFINGERTPEAQTTEAVAQMLLDRANSKYNVAIRHVVEIPIGAGFGSSAGGALGTGLALSKALSLNMTLNQIGRIAHIAEIRCRTGLGTVGPLTIGGCIVTIEPGAPGTAIIDRIPISADHMIIAGVLGLMSTKEVLSSPERRQAVNMCGKKTLDNILAEPSLEHFMDCCLNFAEETGFLTRPLRKLATIAKKAGAIGAAQNMVGDAIHALAASEDAERVIQAFERVLPREKILVSNVDTQGARLLR